MARGGKLREIARVLPACAILLRRLLGDPRVSRRRKLLLALVVAYLAFPLDLIPDFIPVLGQLDDALVIALALRSILRDAGPETVREHWPGPPESLGMLLRLAGGGGTEARAPSPSAP
jgi:uncharacterized membrane protein YkvA (DUF1232 family)